jgi:hypothetical protein
VFERQDVGQEPVVFIHLCMNDQPFVSTRVSLSVLMRSDAAGNGLRKIN